MSTRTKSSASLKRRKSPLLTVGAENWEPTYKPYSATKNKPSQCDGLRCWARAPPQGDQGSQLSLLKLIKKDWARAQQMSDFIVTDDSNKFSLVLNLEGRRSPYLISSGIVRHLRSVDFVPRFFQVLSNWRIFPNRIKMSCKEASTVPRSISPVLKRTWEGSYSLYFDNGNLCLKIDLDVPPNLLEVDALLEHFNLWILSF